MAWQDRLREAAYTSPGGSRIRFDFVAVTRETTKRTTVFDFPRVPNAYVQDNGFGSRRYAMTCFFSGDNHDLDATAFEAALLERGRGRLEHPLYGTFDVVPAGDITRRDDLRDAANQTIVEVTFWTSVAAVYPAGQTDQRSEVLAALTAFRDASAQQFEDSADLSTVGAQATAQASVTKLVSDVDVELGDLFKVSDAINEEYLAAQRAITDSLDVLIGEPLELANRIVDLVMIPARAPTPITQKLEGYASLLERVITAPQALPSESFENGVVLPARRRTVANDFHISLLFAVAAHAGAIRSVVEATFQARPHAIAAAAAILDELDTVVPWMDDGFAALGDADAPGGIDTGATCQGLQEATVAAVGGTVEIAFTLLPERHLVLDRARTVIDLAAELYGSIDDGVARLIDTNDFSGSEILELERGTSVVYYA